MARDLRDFIPRSPGHGPRQAAASRLSPAPPPSPPPGAAEGRLGQTDIHAGEAPSIHCSSETSRLSDTAEATPCSTLPDSSPEITAYRRSLASAWASSLQYQQINGPSIGIPCELGSGSASLSDQSLFHLGADSAAGVDVPGRSGTLLADGAVNGKQDDMSERDPHVMAELQAELQAKCERLNAEYLNGLAENRSSAESNAQLRSTLLARQSRLEETERAVAEEEERSRARLESLGKRAREEWAQVEALRRLVSRAEADCDAADTSRAMERERLLEAASCRNELAQQRVVLAALQGQLQSLPSCLNGNANTLQRDAEVEEREPAAIAVVQLRAELDTARQELDEQNARGERVGERAQALEEELQALRAVADRGSASFARLSPPGRETQTLRPQDSLEELEWQLKEISGDIPRYSSLAAGDSMQVIAT